MLPEADPSGFILTLIGNTGVFKCFQSWCATDEFIELWCTECDLIVEHYGKEAELRGIDVRHEVL